MLTDLRHRSLFILFICELHFTSSFQCQFLLSLSPSLSLSLLLFQTSNRSYSISSKINESAYNQYLVGRNGSTVFYVHSLHTFHISNKLRILPFDFSLCLAALSRRTVVSIVVQSDKLARGTSRLLTPLASLLQHNYNSTCLLTTKNANYIKKKSKVFT